MNLSTILIGLAVLGIFAAIVIRGVKKRSSTGGCGCGCSGCPGAGLCHGDRAGTED